MQDKLKPLKKAGMFSDEDSKFPKTRSWNGSILWDSRSFRHSKMEFSVADEVHPMSFQPNQAK
jgi:hypothetical protein